MIVRSLFLCKMQKTLREIGCCGKDNTEIIDRFARQNSLPSNVNSVLLTAKEKQNGKIQNIARVRPRAYFATTISCEEFRIR